VSPSCAINYSLHTSSGRYGFVSRWLLVYDILITVSFCLHKQKYQPKRTNFCGVAPYNPGEIHQRFWQPYPSTMKFEAMRSSKTSMDCYLTTRHHIPDRSTLHNYRHENPKSDKGAVIWPGYDCCDSSVSMVTRLRAGRVRNRGLISDRDKKCSCTLKRSDRLWSHLIAYPLGTWGSFPGGELAWRRWPLTSN
jgi:hypothetical protein